MSNNKNVSLGLIAGIAVVGFLAYKILPFVISMTFSLISFAISVAIFALFLFGAYKAVEYLRENN